MTWVVPLALGGLAIMMMAVFTMLSARKRHHLMVQPAQTVGPRILIHDINDDRCTGCDACVAVCPTNVLDLVANKSRVLRFQDCIQCEACMFACPTEALVMFPEDGVPPPLKVPEIDEYFQTAVPGQYLIGEVAGKPLVKNAANLGRAVVEHMLVTGLRPSRDPDPSSVDVVIVGSGPGGLSAALTCIQRGLTYVVLEKEQMIASTIARYPKGKLVMAEPYDTVNYSLLPVFDSSKEQLLPVWGELVERVGLRARLGESVESIHRASDGTFEVRTTVGAYRSQRVVLSIGTRGKPRTLQVPGENLPKVHSLLEDPDDWQGRAVLVVGGGDSACEAALALADAGAIVTLSYRGKGFNRAAPKNRQAIEHYAAEGRIKAKLGSQVLGFASDSVTLALADGTQKQYRNDGAFVLIGADPPLSWLEKVGIRFVERPHQHQMPRSDEVVVRLVPRPVECPEDAARAAAQVLGGSIGVQPVAAAAMSLPGVAGELPVSGPRKWLRSATSIFSSRGSSQDLLPPPRKPNRPPSTVPEGPPAGPKSKKLDAPMPLSEFAKRTKPDRSDGQLGSARAGSNHTGHGRRDQLSAGERTRILRMLRDEGGRLADEDSQVMIAQSANEPTFDFDFEDDAAAPVSRPSAGVVAPPPPSARMDIPAKPAVVVGLAQAQAARSKRKSGSPPSRELPRPAPVPPSREQPSPRSTAAAARGAPRSGRRPVPAPFSDEPTRQVDGAALQALRLDLAVEEASTEHATKHARHVPPTDLERTRLPRAPTPKPKSPPTYDPGLPTPALFDVRDDEVPTYDPATLEDVDAVEDATQLAGLEALPADDRTRAVNIRNEASISDIDWDID